MVSNGASNPTYSIKELAPPRKQEIKADPTAWSVTFSLAPLT